MSHKTPNPPGRRELRIRSAPRAKQVFWCAYPDPAHTEVPEFYKRRPVVVLSRKATLYGVVTVVPLSGKPQSGNRNSLQMHSPIEGKIVWAVCNHIHTLSTRRLHPPAGGIPKVSDEDFREILKRVCNNLPLLPPREGEGE